MKLHGPFKHPPYRYPVDTGTFHCTLFNTLRDHKVAKGDQIFGKNSEFMLDFFSVGTQNTAKNTIFSLKRICSKSPCIALKPPRSICLVYYGT